MAPFEFKQGFRTSYKEAKAVWNGALKGQTGMTQTKDTE